MKYLISFLFFSLTVLLNAQITEEERKEINDKIIYGNQLISHINTNIVALESYQDMLNAWAKDTLQDATSIPSYTFLSFTGMYQSLGEAATIGASPFDVDAQLSQFQKEVILFDSFGENLAYQEVCNSKKECYLNQFTKLKQVELTLQNLYNLCYDFSLTCAVVYEKEKLVRQQEQLKDVVAQTKNIIMAMHENNAALTKTYLSYLDTSLEKVRSENTYRSWSRTAKLSISEEQLVKHTFDILDEATSIASSGEQFIQGNANSSKQIVNGAIMTFNKEEGISSLYNKIVTDAAYQYLYYIKEPMYFEAKEVTFIDIIENTVDEPKVDSIQVEIDEENDFSLLGAKANNVVILMDVSGSMLNEEKNEMLRTAILHYTSILRDDDVVSLISYAGNASVLIEAADKSRYDEVVELLNNLRSKGFTDIHRGLKMSYETAADYFIEDGNNIVIIASDGEFDLLTTMYPFIQEKAALGIYTSVFHFSNKENTPISNQLQRIADTGTGAYTLIENNAEAVKAIMNEVKKE